MQKSRSLYTHVYSKGKLMLSQVLLLATLFSCTKEDTIKQTSQDVTLQAITSTSATSSLSALSQSNLLFEETVEGTSPFSTAKGIENCGTDWTLSYVTNPAFKGLKSARFEIRKDQPLVGSSEKVRSEISVIKGTEDSRFTKEMWYSYAIYFPSAGMEYDATRECITQWHEDGSDETTVRCEKDKAYLEVCPPAGSSTMMKYDLFRPSLTSASASTTGSPTSFVTIPKNAWHEFVFHIIHSTGSDGLIEIWRDGVKIHNIPGRNMHLEYPKWKLGLYKASFLDKSSQRDARVLYFDNIRVGNSSASFASMTSGSTATTPTTPPTEPTTPTAPVTPPVTSTNTQQIASYTLVNASTEKDIMTIVPGAIISLRSIGATKLSIRANTANTAAGVVKMVMSGADSKTRYDDVVPYALFGDDQKGDYYSWSPKIGSYTLKATPYAGTKDKMGEATGPEYSVNFTIVK